MAAHPFEFGVFVPQGWKMELVVHRRTRRRKWAKAVEIAVLAEELGYDSLWVYDHFHNVPRPGARGRVRVLDHAGRHQPAHEPHPARPDGRLHAVPQPGAAGQDHLEHRRDLAAAASTGASAPAGTSTSTRATATSSRRRRTASAMLRETRRDREGDVDRARRRPTRASTSSSTGAQCDPKPLQQPHPPIWIGGGGEQLTLRVVARHADALELRRQARRVGAQVRGAEGPLRRRRSRLRRDPQDVVARGVHPRDRGRRSIDGRHAARSGASRSSRGGRATSSARPSRWPRRSRPTSTSAAPASARGARDYPDTETLRLFAEKVIPEFR